MRPLGIPTMQDRVIQQMFKQVLEPICEAQFYKHSYGFRPNRSTKHALARCNFIMYSMKCHYVVDIDIKSFFDNVNHTKIIKQLYTIGICDKRVLSIIARMLKAPIKDKRYKCRFGIPHCGVPQGGVLSTLLSNVVLNDLDWWIGNQWETFESRKKYCNKGDMHKMLKQTKLKQMHIVRYCDDFKVFTNNRGSADKIYHAVKGYVENYLKLEISVDKSRITNLKKKYSEFLGFEIKVEKQKKNQYATISRVARKAIERIKREVKIRVKRIAKNPIAKNIQLYNLYVLGVHNYYKHATRVSLDFSKIAYSCLPTMYSQLTKVGVYCIPRSPPLYYTKMYKTKRRTFKVNEIYLFPISYIQWKRANYFNPKINNYTINGRNELIKQLNYEVHKEIIKFQCAYTEYQEIEYMDNRLSRYSMQMGRCAVTKEFITADMVHCHHIKPRYLSGSDKFDNLVIVSDWVHILIHATELETIYKYLKMLKINEKQLKKLNKFRK